MSHNIPIVQQRKENENEKKKTYFYQTIVVNDAQLACKKRLVPEIYY